MSRTFHHGERRLRVRAIRRSDPDLPKYARALLDLAEAQAEAEAEAEHKKQLDNVVELTPNQESVDPEKDAA
jgi:hypothetical protein